LEIPDLFLSFKECLKEFISDQEILGFLMVSSSFMKIPGILCFVFTTWQWCDLLEQFSLDGLYSSPPSPLSSSELQKNCENDGFTLSPLSYLTSRSNTFSVI
jgi:hypothetical protein